jgi:hypothetical protein
VGVEPGRVVCFFFDRNLGKRVPETMSRRGWDVERHDDHFGQTTPDTEIMSGIASRGWVFITQDKRIRRRAPEREALIGAGLRTFAIISTANLSAVETGAVLVRAEAAIFEAIEAEEGPFLYGIVKDGSLHRFELE